MINITDKHDCCGCSACVVACPKQCIAMLEDAEGFLYPEVDAAACVDCGLCEKVCPWLNTPSKRHPQDVVAAKNRNGGDLIDSSSGGVFIALARQVVASGGVVFGAVFDDRWEVVHAQADTVEAVRPMMGSKYVQSRMEDAFASVVAVLRQGRRVLFVGTPCQVAGLNGYLRRGYENLLTVDFLCHGVPSPGVWRRYLRDAFTGRDGRVVITSVEFRNKRKEGWARYNVVVKGRDGGGRGDERELSASVYVDNPFMRGFMADVYLRPSCHQCKCKGGSSRSDLTIADYWGVASLLPDFADDRGVSLVFVNSPKGQSALAMLDIDVCKANIKGAERFNGGFNDTIPERPRRRKFFEATASGADFQTALDRALRVPPYKTALKKLTTMVRKTLSRIVK